MRPFALALVLLAACADISTEVNVAPSAHDDVVTIANAVASLNDAIGEDVYRVRMVNHEHRVNGQIIVRVREFEQERKRGDCEMTAKGVIVRLSPLVTELVVAHELGHAAGLDHHPDEGNLMHWAAGGWALTDEQKATMLDAIGTDDDGWKI